VSKFPKHFDKNLSRTANELADLVETDYRKLLPVIKEMVDSGKEQFNREPSCKNCKKPGCCYQLIFVSFYEAFPIARRLRMEGKATRDYIAELRRIGEEAEGMGRVAWFDKNQPCVFLNDEYRCTVYDIRPTMCSSHFVYTPPENCLPEAVDPELHQLGSSRLQDSIIRQQIQFIDVLGLERLAYYGSMPRMVAIVLEAMAGPQDKFIDHLRNQPYPLSAEKLSEWMDGQNPFAEQRGRCERAGLGPVEPLPGSGTDS
jgi:Fe-S-cluster containining protein